MSNKNRNLATDEQTKTAENNLRSQIENTLDAIGVPLANQIHVIGGVLEDLKSKSGSMQSDEAKA
jgi:hypothetical protein